MIEEDKKMIFTRKMEWNLPCWASSSGGICNAHWYKLLDLNTAVPLALSDVSIIVAIYNDKYHEKSDFVPDSIFVFPTNKNNKYYIFPYFNFFIVLYEKFIILNSRKYFPSSSEKFTFTNCVMMP